VAELPGLIVGPLAQMIVTVAIFLLGFAVIREIRR